MQEGVPIMGTLGILDQLWDQQRISVDEQITCLQGLLNNNGGAIRLPKAEIISRLEAMYRISRNQK